MNLDRKLWRHFGGAQLSVDAMILAVLGLVGFLMLRYPGALSPLEGGLLVATVGFLLILGRRALGWHRAMTVQAFLPEWAERILAGDLRQVEPPPGLDWEQRRVAEVINQALGALAKGGRERKGLVEDYLAEWEATEGVLRELEGERDRSFALQEGLLKEMAVLGEELRHQLESGSVMARVAERRRGLADAAASSLGSTVDMALDQLKEGIERQEELLQQLRDTLPRMRREADALTQMADRALRRAARLDVTIRGVASHGAQMQEGVQDRAVQLLRLRELALDLRELGEGLQRRALALRTGQESLSDIEESLQSIDHVAKQTGLLAVNAAILSQEGRGSRGFQVIGSKIRLLSEQTTEGTAHVSRLLGEHRLRAAREAIETASLSEALQTLQGSLHELLLNAGRVDHQGQELDRALEAHQDMIRALEQAGTDAIEVLRELGPKAQSIESLVQRQRGAEQDLEGQQTQSFRIMERLGEGARALIRSQEEAHADLWFLMDRHENLRHSRVYRAFTQGQVGEHLEGARARRAEETAAWAAAADLRAQRNLILGAPPAPPKGHAGVREEDRLALRMLEPDAFGLPRTAAVTRLKPQDGGRVWELSLAPALQSEEGRLALLVGLRESLAELWIPDPDLVFTQEGVRLSLPFAYPNLPLLLAGLGAELTFPQAHPEWELREPVALHPAVCTFAWMDPRLSPQQRHALLLGLHHLVEHQPGHEAYPLGPAPGVAGPCPRCTQDQELRARPLPPDLALRFWSPQAPEGLGAWKQALRFREGDGPVQMTVGRLQLPYPRPEALLLALAHPRAGFLDASVPTLAEVAAELRAQVLAAPGPEGADRAWELLRRLERGGWIMALPEMPTLA